VVAGPSGSEFALPFRELGNATVNRAAFPHDGIILALMTKAKSYYVCAVAGIAVGVSILVATSLLHIEHRVVLSRSFGGQTWWLRWDALLILLLLYLIFGVASWKLRLSALARDWWRVAFVFALLGVVLLSLQRGVSDCFPGFPCSQKLKHHEAQGKLPTGRA
jgi:hypothetical protein